MGWKPIPKFEGLYEASEDGRIRSLDRIDSIGRKVAGRVLKPRAVGKGYLQVSLFKDGCEIREYVHRLVALTLIGACPDGLEVCHKDHNKRNNRASNLMYGTSSENKQQSIQNHSWISEPVRRSDGLVFDSMAEAARLTNTPQSSISQVCSGKLKTAGGFGWEKTK